MNPSAQAVDVPVDQQPTLKRVHALFVNAHYDWANPLSPRSFAAWRDGLKRREDRVTVLWGEHRVKRSYRLRTATQAGDLRAASLTFRAVDYRVVEGAFEFQTEPPITLAEIDEVPKILKTPLKQTSPVRNSTEVEAAATPEDELRVFAALNKIGADVEDPIDVRLDNVARHVVVTGIGLSVERRNEITGALTPLPHTAVRLGSAQAKASPNTERPGKQDTLHGEPNSAFRREMETRAGGALALQTITDRALDASNSLLSQAHALQILAREFPPKVELTLPVNDQNTLRDLRQRHAMAMEQLSLQVGEALRPLLVAPTDDSSSSTETHSELPTSWQSSVADLYQTTRSLDRNVSRLFTYRQDSSDQLPLRLRRDLDEVEQLARAQVRSAK